ncbi:usherin, partial [Elysia marginata]
MIYQGDGTVFQHSVSALTPYSEHTFILEACNGVGCTNSTAVTGRTLVDAPEGVKTPQIEGFNTSAMRISWDEPSFPNGPPPSYRVEKTNIALSYPASVVRGTRFTGGGYYQFRPEVIPQGVAFTGIRFRFRLESGTGVLLFSASSSQEEFVAVQFIKGRPRFLFDTQGPGSCSAVASIDYDSYTNWTTMVQSGFHTLEIHRLGNSGYMLIDGYFRGCDRIAFVTTTNDEGLVYNDGKWHSFEARRTGIYGAVQVDQVWTGESYIRDPSCQGTSIIGPTEAVYVGGFPSDFVLRRDDPNKRIETSALEGCIDSIEIMMQMYPEQIWRKLDWSEGVTNELAFLNWQGCPINLQPGFHFMGKGYLVIENSCDKRGCDISGNEITVDFRMRTTLHTSLLFLVYGGSRIYMYSYMTNGRLVFMLSDSSTRTILEYSDAAVNFCDGQWRALTFHKLGQQARILVDGTQVKAVGDPGVAMDLPLISDLHVGGIKSGSEAAQFVQDNGLLVPGEGFGGCLSRLEINGNKYWEEMEVVDIANTNLDGCPPYYTPAAEDTCQASLISVVYSGSDRVAFDTGLTPYTDYIYRVVASNEAGEGFSSWGYGRTREGAAPSGVAAPTEVRSISGHVIEVTWQEPETTYGLLTKYVVVAYVVGAEGNDSYVSQDVFQVTPTAGVYSLQLPRVSLHGIRLYGGSISCHQHSPTATHNGQSAYAARFGIQASWTQPSQLNGVLKSYLLYATAVSTGSAEPPSTGPGGALDELVYNSTVLITYTTIEGLLAGTTYNISLGACTEGGCTVSVPAVATTEESAPQGVPEPVISAPSSSRLEVTWQPPQFPNGRITHYILLQNGAEVYNGLDHQYAVDGLAPYSRHTFRVRACTLTGCAASNQVEARTLEMPPQGNIVLSADVEDSRTVNVSWTTPENLNGFMTYNVFVTGLYYVNTEAWNYSTVNEQRVLLNETVGYTVYQLRPLVPMSRYSIQINGTNSMGFILSNIVQLDMPPGTPDGMAPPELVSETSRSVKATWKPVGRVNADEDPAYVLQFKDSDSAQAQDEFGPTVTLSYTKTNLLPYKEYFFRVIVRNSIGQTVSDWASVVTQEDKPGSMGIPLVAAVRARYVDLTWSAPLSPNGILTAYKIYANSELKTQVLGNTTAARVDHLTPFNFYTFEVEACTQVGCTRGASSSRVRSLEDVPTSLQAPTLRSMSPSAIEIVCTEPGQANGQISEYIIERAEGQDRTNITMLVTRPPEMTKTYIDESNELVPFTEYSYRVNVRNGADGGCTESTPTRMRTEAATPAPPPAPSPTAVSSSRISILWQASPSVNGPGVRYELSRLKFKQPLDTTAADINTWQSVYRGDNRFYEDTDLPMFTTYIYRVTVFNDVGQAVSANSSQVTTFGGLPRLPASVSAQPIDHLSVRVNWTLPSPVELQGEVQTLTLEGQSSLQNVTAYPPLTDNSYVLGSRTSLTPNTEYAVSLEVTIYGGASITSAPVMVRTLSGAPEGLPPPVLSAVSTSEIRVSWLAPIQPNGDIISYTIIVGDRRVDPQMVLPGSFVIGGLQPYTVYSVTMEACTVFSCTTSVPSQGVTAEAPPQGQVPPVVVARSPTEVCCDGTLHDAQPDYGCCGTQYISKPSENLVCCGGKFYTPQDNFQCCGERYIRVPDGEICCPDPNEDRVSVSKGDACCGGMPYVSGGSQICCQSKLTDVQVHYYGDESEKQTASDKCCGTSRISSNLGCCNYISYDTLTQVCADKSQETTGCGTGVVCPLSQGATAFCNRCDFDRTQLTCGSDSGGNSSTAPTAAPSSNQDQEAVCTTETEKIYSGTNTSFVDTDLKPFSQYEYSVVSVNSAGSVRSDYTSAQTAQAAPQFVHPPTATVAEGQLFVFQVSWTLPGRPNGEITSYTLKRDGIELYRGLALSFQDDLNILPYRSYSYQLSACNQAGCADSDL